MTTTSIEDRVDELFADARDMQSQAIVCLDGANIRYAAEKAWRATDGLILARTGEEPVTTGRTTDGLDTVDGSQPRKVSWSAISAAWGNSTAPASATNAATRRPNGLSETPAGTLATPKFWQPNKHTLPMVKSGRTRNREE